jgi:hypothetical protein
MSYKIDDFVSDSFTQTLANCIINAMTTGE